MDLQTRKRLALILQDVWGYFDTILGGDMFAGMKESKLRGKLRLYKSGRNHLLEATDMLPKDDPAHERALNMPDYDDLDDERALRSEATVGRQIATTIGKRYGLDVRMGTVVGQSADVRRRTSRPRKFDRGSRR